MHSWSNWSGSVVAQPKVIAAPRTEDALSALVASAGKVRAVGAGHSFAPLCETSDTLISLHDLDVGGVTLSADRAIASVPAGWSLKRLTEALWAHGVSLANQGDVNPQSVAGAISTGTHGAGLGFGSLSTLVRAVRLVRHDGSIALCSRSQNPNWFEAARLSLGALGVITRLDLDVEPAFYLEERIASVPYEEAKAAYLEWARENRHVEFFVFPYAKPALVKRLNTSDVREEPARATDMDESAFRFVCDVSAAAPWLTPTLQALLAPKNARSTRNGPAYRIYPSERTVRFEEMEYVLPLEAAFAALDMVMARIRAERWAICFPFEVRIVNGDGIWLSPFNRGPAIAISMHQYAKMAWREAFVQAEAIFRDHGGRPHWGKRHTMTPHVVRAHYPQLDAFLKARAEVDPAGKFLNAHLGSLFETAQPEGAT